MYVFLCFSRVCVIYAGNVCCNVVFGTLVGVFVLSLCGLSF